MGKSDQSNYDSGTPVTWARTKAVVLPSNGKVTLTFWLWFDIESDAKYDRLWLDARSPWSDKYSTLVASLKDQKAKQTWHFVTVPLTSWLGKSVEVRAYFDAEDSKNNTTKGVYIDDMRIVVDNCP